MSDTAGISWYRHGRERLLCAMLVSALSVLPLIVIIHGITRPVGWALIAAGAVLLAVVAAGTWLPLRAGIGVAPEHILIRTAAGRTRMVPWAQVTGFEAVERPKSATMICVLTAGGKRWATVGCTADDYSPRETWHLLRALETELLARVPGPAGTLPPRPPRPDGFSPAPLFIGLTAIAFIAVGAIPLFAGITELGPAIRAARGAGTAGYYVRYQDYCGKGCNGDGVFQLPGGTITRPKVLLRDAPSAVRVGEPAAALDTGAGGVVFPRDDPGAWHYAAGEVVLGGWFYAVVLVSAIRLGIRRVRRPRGRYGSFTAAPLRARR